MKQLILLEGLPGTGKTTATRTLFDCLSPIREDAFAFFEGDERIPCDFYEMAGIPAKEFDSFHDLHSGIAKELLAVSMRTANYVYLRLDRCSEFIASTFRKWDMGDEHNQQVDVLHYVACALERLDYWVSLNACNESTVIIDSGFLQNPINELLFRGASDEVVRSFMQETMKRVKFFNPFCFYLRRESAEAAMSFARQAKGDAWSAGIDALLEMPGCANFFERRFKLELDLLPFMPHIICSVQGNDWTDFERQAERFLHGSF